MKRLTNTLFIVLLGSQALFSQGFRLPDQVDSITWTEEKKNKITAFADDHLTKTLIVYHNSERVFQYGDTDADYNIFSIRKSIVSLLFGIYTEMGVIDINVTLRELGIDDKLGLTDQELDARVIDLLKARSGVYHPAAYETPGMAKNRPERGSYQRDEHWYYNNWDFNALTTIFEKLTDTSVFEAFDEKIAKNVGMTNFNVANQKYYKEDVSEHPATIWRLSGDDLALLGQLLMQNGAWGGKQLIPQDWIKQSSQSYSDLGILGGYGYCWWVERESLHYPFVNTPQGTYSARGTGEQNLVIIPSENMVIVHQTEVNSPEDQMMRVVDFGKLMLLILDQKMF